MPIMLHQYYKKYVSFIATIAKWHWYDAVVSRLSALKVLEGSHLESIIDPISSIKSILSIQYRCQPIINT